jgi:6-pyruvoyltetrahydropterin/6-carboxytetrahydropterin synthase
MATRCATEITLPGNIITDEGMANQDMAMDYSEVKRIAKDVLINKWGHAFRVYLGNTQTLKFLQSIKDHKTAILNKPL